MLEPSIHGRIGLMSGGQTWQADAGIIADRAEGFQRQAAAVTAERHERRAMTCQHTPHRLAHDKPCRLARSAVFSPASASFSTPIICLPANFDFFMQNLQLLLASILPDSSHSRWRHFPGQGQPAQSEKLRLAVMMTLVRS